MDKIEKRRLFRKFKELKYSKEIRRFVINESKKQQKVIQKFNPSYLHFTPYNLPFKKQEFINNISSFSYKGRVGRKIDLLLYYDDILLGYVQFGSPILTKPLSEYLKKNYFKSSTIDFKEFNNITTEISICIGIGYLTKFLSGKLLILSALTYEPLNLWNKKYGCNIRLVTTTSIYGKSSMYNRVKNLQYLGLSEGYNSLMTEEQRRELLSTYRKVFPHRSIKKRHYIRMYDHLMRKNIQLSFIIPKLNKGVYISEEPFPHFTENTYYWYKRWFLPRKDRLIHNT